VSGSVERFLILAVDRDGDLENKAGVRSPVYGRDQMLVAATKLAIADPEEADANAMFAAVREYDRLRRDGIECEVAVACGKRDSGFDADRKIRREVDFLLGREAYSGVVFVSDGVEDEQILPVIQSVKPITSIVRIVIKHSRTVEETYLVLGRYLRMLIYDTRYSKWAVGVPGIIFILAGILIVLNQTVAAGFTVLLIVGTAFLVRGFNVDRFIAGILSQRPAGYVRLFSIVASILIFVVAMSTGVSGLFTTKALVAPVPPSTDPSSSILALVSRSPILFLSYGPELIGYFIQGAISLLWASFGVYLTGAVLAHLTRGSVKAWRDAVGMVILALLYFPTLQFSKVLIDPQQASSILLVSYVLVGLAAITIVATTVYARLRTRSSSGVLRE
jgi:putative membrane protein